MNAIQVIYSPVNQAYLIMWYDHVLAIRNTWEEASEYLASLEGR